MKDIYMKRLELIREILITRSKLEDRIVNLGGEIPKPWAWDDDGTLRNLQLLEVVEKLEREERRRNAK
jgi:hypothetical protein